MRLSGSPWPGGKVTGTRYNKVQYIKNALSTERSAVTHGQKASTRAPGVIIAIRWDISCRGARPKRCGQPPTVDERKGECQSTQQNKQDSSCRHVKRERGRCVESERNAASKSESQACWYCIISLCNHCLLLKDLPRSTALEACRRVG